MTKILSVEDEHKLAHLLADYIVQAGFDYHILHRGDELLPWLAQEQADLVLLDIMLPGEDGISLCRKLRAQSNIPIIIQSARVDEMDRLLGLELGADDYICKPFSPKEVIARIKAVLRRSHSTQEEAAGYVMILDE